MNSEATRKTLDYYREHERDLPIVRDVDVVVVGGGSAGVGAAVKAAREGAETLLIEAAGVLGGMWTMAMQSHATCFNDGEKVIVGGLAREIIQRLHELGVGEDPDQKVQMYPGSVATNFEAEWMKCVLDDVVVEAGVDPWAKPEKGNYYEVPYRSLVPESVNQLLVAGRCISADRIALGSCRTTVCCVELGEAAGLAAAIAARTGIKVREVDGAMLKKQLLG